MNKALLEKEVYREDLDEILRAQKAQGGGEYFIQPKAGDVIRLLKERQPTPEAPVRLYVSTTKNRNQICYTAEIVRWEDKRQISERRRQQVADHLKQDQPSQADYFKAFDAKTAVNLMTIRSLRQLSTPLTTALLNKVHGGIPPKKTARAGKWVEVWDIGDLVELPTEEIEQQGKNLSSRVAESMGLSDDALEKKLAAAPRLPEKVQIVSVGFRRNPYVIAAVLRRAKGVCERCKKEAPFLRRYDRTPYLEIHHWKQLSEDGEDTVENAAALCPNCHREMHYGQPIGE